MLKPYSCGLRPAFFGVRMKETIFHVLAFYTIFLAEPRFERIISASDTYQTDHTEPPTDEPLPDLEPEEPAAEWPSSLHFSPNPYDWPGNGEPLGHRSPKLSVDRVKMFPTRKTFIEDYSQPLVPLQIIDPLKGTNFEKNWPKDSFFTSNAFAALRRVNISDQAKRTEESSLRDYFLRKSWDKSIYLETSIPDYMRLDFPVPVSIQCKAIVDELLETRLRNYPLQNTRTTVHSVVDRLVCVGRGRLNVSLVHTIQVQRDSNFTVDITDDAPEINYAAVDYEKFPALRFARFLEAKLRATDCLFIPAKWLMFQATSEDYLEAELNWNHKRIDEKTCGDTPSEKLTLGLLSMQKEPDIDLHAIIEIAPLQQFFNGVGQKNFTLEQLEEWLQKDKKVLARMTEWNDEYAEITGELFMLLDLNRDAFFSADDLNYLTLDRQALFLGRLNDKMEDFSDLMRDQQADLPPGRGTGSTGGLTPELKAELEKYNREMKKLIADAVAEKKQREEKGNVDNEKPSQVNTDKPKERRKPKPTRQNFDREVEIVDAATEVGAEMKINNDVEEEIFAEEEDSAISLSEEVLRLERPTNKEEVEAVTEKKDEMTECPEPRDEL